MSDWTISELGAWDNKICEIAGNFGLNWFDIDYEIIDYHEMISAMSYTGLPTHFAVLFGASLRSIGFAEGPGSQLFLFQILRDQMSAAVRLGVIGPLEAARRQQGLYEYCARILDEVDGIEYTGATRTAPQLDIAQSLHDHLYSRLFQS